MNLKRALAFERGDTSLCPVCSKNWKTCPHNRKQAYEKIEEEKIKAIVDKRLKQLFGKGKK